MKKEMNICGYTRSTFMFEDNVLFLVKYDDGRFEYRGVVTVAANTGVVIVPHPFENPVIQVSAIGTNYYSNYNMIFISTTCDSRILRIDCISPTEGNPKNSCGVNIFVQGFWK